MSATLVIMYVCKQFTTENAELERQITAMKETQQKFIAEVWFGYLYKTVIMVRRKMQVYLKILFN